MKKSLLTAVHEVWALAMQGFKSETELERIAEAIWPGWKSHRAEWYLYEFLDTGVLLRESGYGLARFGLGGYGDGCFLCTVKRAERETHPIPARYELCLIVNDDAGHFCLVNCETGMVKSGPNWPHPVPAIG